MKRVTFKETVYTREHFPKLESNGKNTHPICPSYSMLGDCPLQPSGKCQRRHSGNLCFQFRDRGMCSWKENCKFRHPIEYRRFKQRQSYYQSDRRRHWFPPKEPRTQWRAHQAVNKTSSKFSPTSSFASLSPSSSRDLRESSSGQMDTSALGERSGLSSNETGGLSPTGNVADLH